MDDVLPGLRVAVAVEVLQAILKGMAYRASERRRVVDLPDDVMEAVRWHVDAGYAGPEFLFSKDGDFPKYVDSHKRPLRTVQRTLGLRELGHHAIGRRSVASQANHAGHSVKAIQAQLGHRSRQSTDLYIATTSNAAGQLRLVQALAPSAPAHVINRVSTGIKEGTWRGLLSA